MRCACSSASASKTMLSAELWRERREGRGRAAESRYEMKRRVRERVVTGVGIVLVGGREDG